MNTGDKPTHADNQQVSKKISDDYIVGFVDGEGCFYVGFSKRDDLPIKWQIITEFHITQNPGSQNVLEAIQKRFGCGYLKPNHAKSTDDKTWVLVIKDRKDLKEHIIPFFDTHPLLSAKRHDYFVFKQVLLMIEKRSHLTKEGFTKIVELVFSLNRQTKKRYTKAILLSS